MRRTVQLLVQAIIAGVVVMTPAISSAQGEHARRAATELLVLAGDARRLAQEKTSKLHAKGLAQRMRGGLAGLDLLLRLADQERAKPPRSYADEVAALRAALGAGTLDQFALLAAELIAAFPFRTAGILPAGASKERLERGRALHEELCAGCHDAPDLEVERPAYNLFQDASRLPAQEFAARMVVGVRGERITGIDNPLSDEQIAGLIAWYRGRAN